MIIILFISICLFNQQKKTKKTLTLKTKNSDDNLMMMIIDIIY